MIKNIFKTKWFNIDKIKYKKEYYFKINHNNAVLILGLTKDKKIILIKQYRPIRKKNTLEFPSGNIEKYESPLKAAKREFFEETGYVSKKWKLLGRGVLRLERESSVNYFFLALDCYFLKHPSEKIKTKLINRKNFKRLLKNNKINQIAGYPLVVWAYLKSKINLL